ncbi:DNA cytosine methyltransferase, partial [Acinetobacter baumannii]|nr:DNA cytosine methyltransferase [Acinetobacter baumannii]
DGRSLEEPLSTITNTGSQQQLVSTVLSKENLDGALKVAAFLINFYGNGDARDITAPMDTLTTKDRLALVTVWVKGEPWVIVDIRMRMLLPRELYRGQGFPDTYIIDRGLDNKPLSKKDQVHMCGNSVSPLPMAAIARANDPFFNRVAKVEGAA